MIATDLAYVDKQCAFDHMRNLKTVRTKERWASMQYVSTNQAAETATFEEALLKGQAPDLGLYVPTQLPPLSQAQISGWKDASYADIAFSLLTPFVGEEIEAEALRRICEEAYDFEVPLEQADEKRYVLRLDRGPTASFKDFAARAMARMMSYFLQKQERELVILTATSGDTGSAVANAFYGVSGIKVLILFPKDEVTERQRKQMTTLTQNIQTIAVDGKFDDCQAMVKRAFADPSLQHLPLSSANSINIGRLLPQMVYYAYAYSRVAAPPEEVIFAIPCGNFGNMMGAMFAWRMGLPLSQIIIAVNANDEVPVYLKTGEYTKVVPSRNCLSSAMNVGHPSNFTRLLSLYGGVMDHQGKITKAPNMEQMKKELFAISVSDEETKQTITKAHSEHKLILEPHGAVGWFGLEEYLTHYPEGRNKKAICVETAHPAKFPRAIEERLGFDPTLPPSLAHLDQSPEQYETMDNNYDSFVDFLKQHYK